jgi:hypothetical protein
MKIAGGNMVDLDSDPTKLISIVGIGKQLLITRGALTTFSIANDIAVRLGQSRGIVGAVTGHRDHPATLLLLADVGELVLRGGLGEEIVHAPDGRDDR